MMGSIGRQVAISDVHCVDSVGCEKGKPPKFGLARPRLELKGPSAGSIGKILTSGTLDGGGRKGQAPMNLLLDSCFSCWTDWPEISRLCTMCMPQSSATCPVNHGDSRTRQVPMEKRRGKNRRARDTHIEAKRPSRLQRPVTASPWPSCQVCHIPQPIQPRLLTSREQGPDGEAKPWELPCISRAVLITTQEAWREW